MWGGKEEMIIDLDKLNQKDAFAIIRALDIPYLIRTDGIIEYKCFREDGTLQSAMTLELKKVFYKKKGCKAIKGLVSCINRDMVIEPRKRYLKELKSTKQSSADIQERKNGR